MISGSVLSKTSVVPKYCTGIHPTRRLASVSTFLMTASKAGAGCPPPASLGLSPGGGAPASPREEEAFRLHRGGVGAPRGGPPRQAAVAVLFVPAPPVALVDEQAVVRGLDLERVEPLLRAI